MPEFSQRSRDRLETCNARLHVLFSYVIRYRDCTVICGHRDKEDQDKAYSGGFSRLRWPLSKHNSLPSDAVDVLPYPIDWDNDQRNREFGNFVQGVAAALGLDNIVWGGNWETFIDLAHYEVKDAGNQ